MGADIHQEYDQEGNLISLKSAEAWQADWQRDNTGLELYRQMTGGINIRTERDNLGRESRKTVGIGTKKQSQKQYSWGIGNRLQNIHNELKNTSINFEYDVFDNLIRADYIEAKEIQTIYRTPDAIGNYYQSPSQSDRTYAKGGKLIEDPTYHYHYDVEGNLIFKEFKKYQGFSNQGKEALEKKLKIKFKASATGWMYQWAANGMLQQVTNPEHGKIRFGYDPLGRRIFKETNKKRTNWLWDGNVPLHEWETQSTESLINVVTWIFEGGFVPCAKVTQDKSYSIVTDYLGTPTQMFDNEGTNVWEAELDIYGKVRTFKGGSISDCPFRYQGQYLDQETGLYYNRFRYYDPQVGNYISQDPIGLAGGSPTLYGYVRDINSRIDQLGWQEESTNWFDIPSEDLNWTNHGNKHVPPPINKKTTWDDVVKSTKNGPAKYLPGTNIEALERMAWDKGTPVTNGKTWKVMEFDDIIGATEGKPTKYMRVEMSAKTIHGHPISKSEYKKLLKCKS